MLAPSRPANATDTTSIINKRWCQVDPSMWPLLLINAGATSTRNATVATSINKRLCQHTDDESMIQSTRAGIGRCHLAFAVANCALNGRFAAVTVGSCGDCWKLRRLLETAMGCWRGPQYDRECSFYFICYFFSTTPTNRDHNSQIESCLFSSMDAGWAWRVQNFIFWYFWQLIIHLTHKH